LKFEEAIGQRNRGAEFNVLGQRKDHSEAVRYFRGGRRFAQGMIVYSLDIARQHHVDRVCSAERARAVSALSIDPLTTLDRVENVIHVSMLIDSTSEIAS